MKIEIIKIVRKYLLMKPLVTILFCISFLSLDAQTMNYLGGGNYEFDTDYPNSDLHFYLFDDGYHSFNKNTIHTYVNTSLPATPKVYHSEPYDNDDPEETSFYGVNEGVLFAGPTVIELANQIEVKRSWNMVEHKENYFLLMFENVNDFELISGCVEFHFDKNEIQITEDKILDSYGNGWVQSREIENSEYFDYTNKYKWEFYDMLPGEQRFIYIPAECLRDVFSVINTRGILKIDNCNGFVPEDSKLDGTNEEIYDSKMFTLKSIVSNYPHDPNFMVTDPQCLEQEWGAQKVKYKIYFQNDGVDPVEDVLIDLYTSGDINYDNVRLSSSSHNCNLSWEEEAFYISFPDIFLKGMGAEPEPNTYEETIGWVELEICFNLISSINDQLDCINSFGQIIFDDQPPLPISNSLCTSTFCQGNVDIIGADCPQSEIYQQFSGSGLKTVKINEVSKEIDFQIIPNFSKSKITIEGINDYSNLNCLIVNSIGGLVDEINLLKINEINISNLQKGIYYIKVFNNTNSQIKKFVKI